MALTLHFHPLSSFCMKVLVALYETGTPFEGHIVDLRNEGERAALRKLWPIGKFPVLRDDTADRTIPESTIIIEYLAHHHPGDTELIPADAERARETRMRDRFFDLYVSGPMQKLVGDRLRPRGSQDPYGVAEAASQLATAYAIIDDEMRDRRWAMGETFTLADCAAAPALYYANRLAPIRDRPAAAYLDRLLARPSFARVLAEAQPYLSLFPA